MHIVIFLKFGEIDPCHFFGCKSIIYKIIGSHEYSCINCGKIYIRPSRKAIIVKENTGNFISYVIS